MRSKNYLLSHHSLFLRVGPSFLFRSPGSFIIHRVPSEGGYLFPNTEVLFGALKTLYPNPLVLLSRHCFAVPVLFFLLLLSSQGGSAQAVASSCFVVFLASFRFLAFKAVTGAIHHLAP